MARDPVYYDVTCLFEALLLHERACSLHKVTAHIVTRRSTRSEGSAVNIAFPLEQVQ